MANTMQVAVIRVSNNYDWDDDRNRAITASITEWDTVTRDEYEALRRYAMNRIDLVVLCRVEKREIEMTLAELKAKAVAEEEERRLREAKSEKASKRRAEKKKQQAEAKKRAVFEQLKKEFGA